MYNAPHAPPPAPSYRPAPPPRRYPGLRMIASTCIISAWVTLILSVLGGFAMMAGGGLALGGAVAGLSSPGGSGGFGAPVEGGAGNQGQALLTMLALVLPPLKMAAGALTLVSGGISFLVLLGLGQLIYVFIDVEENTRTGAAAMTAIARRMGMTGQ